MKQNLYLNFINVSLQKKKSNDKLYEQYMIFRENSNKLRLVESFYYLQKKKKKK